MRIELTTDYATPFHRPKRAGDIVTFPDAQALRLIAAGMARAAEPEVAVRSASVERAVKRAGRRP